MSDKMLWQNRKGGMQGRGCRSLGLRLAAEEDQSGDEQQRQGNEGNFDFHHNEDGSVLLIFIRGPLDGVQFAEALAALQVVEDVIV